MKTFSKILFWLLGWKIIGPKQFPKKCVIIAAPHTSNWDYFFARLYGNIIGIRPHYLIKSSFFVPLLATIVRLDGGIPVFRNSKNNLVDQISSKFNKSDNFIIGISPEGTRSRVEKWKTGFYHIALKSNVPIVLVGLDFCSKEIGIIDSLIPKGNINKDLLFIEEKFKYFKGKIPENYNSKIF